MNIKKILLTILGINYVTYASSAPTLISPTEKNRIENEFNHARSDTTVEAANMRYVKYNIEAQRALEAYRNAKGAISFNVYPYGRNVMQDDLIPEKFHDWQYLFHDTSGNSENSISEICHFRGVKQKRCYSEPNCNREEFTGYRDCYNTLVPKSVNCNWFFQYYPEMVFANLKEIACVRLGIPGRVNLHKQPNSFFCYGLKVNEQGNAVSEYEYPQNDLSFEEGDRCSKCPDDQPLCFDEIKKPLCVSYDMTKKPTFKPTGKPSKKPTTSKPTTLKPTKKGVTYSPTLTPTKNPTKKHRKLVAA